MLQLLPIIRCYSSKLDLDHRSFIWQCYFVTHVVYIFSDYGQHTLNRQIFAEEFRFIIVNLDYVGNELKVCSVIADLSWSIIITIIGYYCQLIPVDYYYN